MKSWNKSWNIPAFLIFNVILFSLLFYFDLNKNISLGAFESIGTVTFKINSIQRKFESGVVWNSIETNSALKNRDTIKTYPESDAIIKLKDETEIQVDENSMIFLDVAGSKPSIQFEGGSIQINNSRGMNANKEFVVKMKNQTLTLIGSDAKIDSPVNGKEVNISMSKGTAILEGNDGKAQKLNSNEIATIGEKGITTRKTPYILNTPTNQSKLISMKFPFSVNFTWTTAGNNSDTTFELSKLRDFKKIDARQENVSSANIDLLPGTYFWRIKGKNPSGIIEYSESRKLILLKESGLLLFAPLNGSTIYADPKHTSVNFSWTPSETVNEYFLHIASNSEFTSNLKKIPVNSNSIAVSDLNAGYYFWKVITKPSANGISPLTSQVNYFYLSTQTDAKTFALISPVDNESIPRSQDLSKNKIQFRWTSISTSKKFRIQISKSSSFNNFLFNEITREKLFNASINQEGTYFWRVAEFSGNSQGNFSNSRSFTISKETVKLPEETKEETTDPEKEEISKLEKKQKEISKIEVPKKDESISNLAPEHIKPASGKIDIRKEKQIHFRWDKVKNAKYYVIRIMEAGQRIKVLITEKTIQNFYMLKNFSKFNEGNFLWEVTPYDKKNKSGKTARGKFTIDLGNDGLKNLKPEEIQILSPDTIYRDK